MVNNRLTTEHALVHAFVTSSVDYCNSVCLPRRRRSMTSCSMFIVQNAAAHRIWEIRAWLSRLMHDDLHWLVIPQRVQYKVAVTVHRCLCHRAQSYLADYCMPVSEVPGCQHLRSARCHQLSVPRVGCSTCAFSFTGATVWNSLPDHLRNPAVDSKQFRQEYKTYLSAGHSKS